MAEKLTRMHKDGDFLSVHPTCVAAHEVAGWTVVQDEAPDEPDAAQEDEPKPAKKPAKA